VRFILEAVEALNLQAFKVNDRGTGSPQYPPSLLLSLLIYCYANGLFSSRQIERATHENLPIRFLCANTHPDHDTLCTFRRENHALFKSAFVQVLELAHRLKVLKVGTITVDHDGTKIQANASKHSAVSYERAGEMIQQLDREVEQLMAKAEAADSKPLQEGLSLPEEIARRQERKAQLEQARAEIEARARQRAQEQQPGYEQKVAQRQAQRAAGQKVSGPEPQPPSPVPEPKDQYNLTDPPSQIMKAGTGQHFEQAYNAQASVEVDSRLIVGESTSNQPNDKCQLVPAIAIVQSNVGPVGVALVDNGFYSQEAVQEVESGADGQPSGTRVYAAVGKSNPHRTVEDLEQKIITGRICHEKDPVGSHAF
jgi:transposase